MLATPTPSMTAAATGLGLAAPLGAPVPEGAGFSDLLLRVVAGLAEAPAVALPGLAMAAAAPDEALRALTIAVAAPAMPDPMAPAMGWTAMPIEAAPAPEIEWRTEVLADAPAVEPTTPMAADTIPAELPAILAQPQPAIAVPRPPAGSPATDIDSPAKGPSAPAPLPAWQEADVASAANPIRLPQASGDGPPVSPPEPPPVPVAAVASSGLPTMPAAAPTPMAPPSPSRTAPPAGEAPPAIMLALPVGVVPRIVPARAVDPAAAVVQVADVPAGTDMAVAAVAPAALPVLRPAAILPAVGPPPAPIAESAAVGREPLPALPQAAAVAEAVHSPAPSPIRQILPITIAMLISPGTAPTLTVTLEPGEMGQLEIRIGRDAEGTTLRLIAERPETTALLQRDQRELQQGLAQSGVRLDAGAIQFETNGGGGHNSDRPPQRHRQARDAPPIHEPDAPASLLDLRI